MKTSEGVPIPYRIIALLQEQSRLFAYPLSQLAEEIRETGFQCSECGMCCTDKMNSNIFLLDHEVDTVRNIDPLALQPAPSPEFCDQNGIYYSSGFSLRMKGGDPRSCWFLENDRCKIYDERFAVCRTFPHMLRGRIPHDENTREWQTFARRDQHGVYRESLTKEECLALAGRIREYENAILTQEVSFLETVHELFTIQDLYHDPAMYETRMQSFREGDPVQVRVYHSGELEEFKILPPNPEISLA